MLFWSLLSVHQIVFAQLGKQRQYWRDIILGVNDGLISTFLLVVGVSGGQLSTDDILLTAIAGALAGMVSMSAGEFVATKAQNEVFHGDRDGSVASHVKVWKFKERNQYYKVQTD